MIKGKLVYWGFIKDPIYGYINITEEDKKLIDTPFFQRLRRVRQVPLIDYVYPSAVHTRFEHSLGVAHLAMNIMANLPIEIDEYEAKMIRSASLLHDIGHGPFSHLFEVILGEKVNKEKLIKNKFYISLFVNKNGVLKLELNKDVRDFDFNNLEARKGYYESESYWVENPQPFLLYFFISIYVTFLLGDIITYVSFLIARNMF